MRPMQVLPTATSLLQDPKQNVCQKVIVQGEPRVEKLESSLTRLDSSLFHQSPDNQTPLICSKHCPRQ